MYIYIYAYKYLYYICISGCCFSSFFLFHIPTIYLSLLTTLLTTFTTVILPFAGVFEKLTGGEFQAKNSSGMVYHYSSR